ncbi:DUF2975 domain-containing protein [Lentilactobacillus kisonensis]|uniref:DUF2975 domain-containing protein n=1 Tax=Lentilactobacillus kisonensis TaxID=481722 RepID=UPI0006CF8716|nr:DUF2975 domain-containing protein [Lentilactobacillus kisonensis]
MKIKSWFLKLSLVCIGIIVALLCGIAFPRTLGKLSDIYHKLVGNYMYLLFFLYLSAVFFYIAEGYAYRILRSIDRDNVFSGQALQAIKRIKYALAGMGICYIFFLPIVYRIANAEDAPGLVLMMAIVAMIPFVVSVFAAILEKLLEKATQLKLENQYTV